MPQPAIFLSPQGPFRSVPSAHEGGLDGSVYQWRGAAAGTRGFQNLVRKFGSVFPLYDNSVSNLVGDLLLASGTANEAVTTRYGLMFGEGNDNGSIYYAAFGGEFIGAFTNTTNYGARWEDLTVAGTVSTTIGSPLLVGVGTNFTTAPLTGPYAYTPSFNVPREGDVIGVGAAGSRIWYRIVSITGATTLTIYPNAVTLTAGVPYVIRRTGRGSYSRVFRLNVGGQAFFYYAGNVQARFDVGTFPGTVEAVADFPPVSNGSRTHWMAPETVDALGAPTGFAPQALDVAWFKGYILYLTPTGVGWSRPGGPSGAAGTAFGTLDFPAQNVSAFAPNDQGVSFEFLGDQLIAIFENSLWLVQATGSKPDFTFYRLAEPSGCLFTSRVTGLDYPTVEWGRPTAAGRGAIYYIGAEGVMKNEGATSTCISAPVASHPAMSPTDPVNLSFDPGLDLLQVRTSIVPADTLVYQPDLDAWCELQWTTGGTNRLGMTFGPGFYTSDLASSPSRRPARFTYGYYDQVTGRIHRSIYNPATGQEAVTLGDGFLWRSPLVNLPKEYPGFQLAGVIIDARGPAAASLAWQLVGGNSPYSVRQIDAGTFLYETGFETFKRSLGAKTDFSYVGVRLSGTGWIELSGVWLLPADYEGVR